MSDIKLNLPKLKGKVIAIDGPAGSGKSTTAKILAARLGYIYLDTGAMYRALTHFALANNVAISNEEKLTVLAWKLSIEFETHEDVNRVFINGVDVTKEIRDPEVTKYVSQVSAYKGVREAMVAKQTELGKNGSIVAEGRDTTTVVFTDADIKVYLDASVNERARRRLLELTKMGVSTNLEEQEANRTHSPLSRARDAIVVDTTNMTIEDQVDRIISLVKSLIK